MMILFVSCTDHLSTIDRVMELYVIHITYIIRAYMHVRVFKCESVYFCICNMHATYSKWKTQKNTEQNVSILVYESSQRTESVMWWRWSYFIKLKHFDMLCMNASGIDDSTLHHFRYRIYICVQHFYYRYYLFMSIIMIIIMMVHKHFIYHSYGIK